MVYTSVISAMTKFRKTIKFMKTTRNQNAQPKINRILLFAFSYVMGPVSNSPLEFINVQTKWPIQLRPVKSVGSTPSSS
jgi:hypothetical protein